MFNKCQVKSSCREDCNARRTSINEKNENIYEENKKKENEELTETIGEPDHSKAVEISQRTEREYVAITAYQPVDVVTRTVEVPFVRTIETAIPKITYENKIKEVPKYYSKIVEKVIEVPEIKYVDKIVDVPHVQYYFKYIPKVEVKENIIKKPVYEKKIVEKIVEVPKIKEVQRYQEVETVEYVVKYIPKNKSEYGENENEDKKQSKITSENGSHEESHDIVNNENETKEKYKDESTQNIVNSGSYALADSIDGARLIKSAPIDMNQGEYLQANTIYNKYIASTSTPEMHSYMLTKSMQDDRQKPSSAFPSFGLQNELSMIQLKKNSSILSAPRIEQVFKPKIVKNIEVQKHVPISVDVPVPYMVPKPVVVNVEVPVLKFRDTFVPIPVRRKIIPKIKWISDVYQVECIKEKPYLKIQDVIKPIPCGVDIKYREFMEKACAINPNELPQDDVHAMWMRVNAHLAEKKKKEYGNLYPYYRNENEIGTFSKMEYHRNGEEGYSKKEELNFKEGSNENGTIIKENRESEEKKILDGNKEEGEIDGNKESEEKEDGKEENEETDENKENIKNNEIEENEEKNSQKSEKSNENIDIQKDEITNRECIKNEYYENNSPINIEQQNFESSEAFMDKMKKKYFEEQSIASLHPSHPLAMTYLQNKWIETDTLRTHELYTNDFIKANINANFNLRNGNIQMSPLMYDKEFLKTANPLMTSFSQNNIRNLENYYNNTISRNINEEASKYKSYNFNEKEDKNEIREIKLYQNIKDVKKEDNDSTNNKCCNYFCKK
ncbi:inner membrane complex protein 1a, putative [Plasmodium relictum]|uniref:Inner membrane complex protein 1a, putative n=1 Tax=Plasmodium relictum TaxID=85471 RepID=A0A1J1H4P9_PLARL|nr:inner membrane complex protein 1a, putative [Plasmodium relictum]CRG99887.1 inner membrane complex protein 1a, putative [Plasmodium relictum]